MTAPLRILNAGLNPARQNAAVSAALAELHRTGRAPDTLRFYRSPASVLLGRHQQLASAVDLARCQARSLEIARRITGGTTAYLAPGVIGLDLLLERRHFGPSLGNSIARICTGLAAGIARTGLPARFQPSGSIVIDRRVVGELTATSDGLTLIFQGFIHLDDDARRIADEVAVADRNAMRPAQGSTRASLAAFLGRVPAAEEIVGVLVAGVSDELRRTIVKGELSADEVQLGRRLASGRAALKFPADSDGRSGTTRIGRKRSAGSTIEIHVTQGDEGLIDEIRIAGDFSIAPLHAVDDLEAALRGVPAAAAAEHARRILESSDVTMSDVAAVDIAAAIAAAVKIRPGRKPRSP